MTGADFKKSQERTSEMDETLLELCKVCKIYLEGELGQVQDVVEEHGLPLALSVMKALSTSQIDPSKYPIEQFQDVFVMKLRERT